MENENVYSAIMDAVKLHEIIDGLTTVAEEKLNQTLHYASTLSESDNRQEKLKQMGNAIALSQFLKIIAYIKGAGVPSSTFNDRKSHLEYVLAVLR